MTTPAAFFARAAIRAYQVTIVPIMPGACRYQPSCSQYAAEAVTRYGALKGSWLALKRIGRCHPWGGFGFDPLPTGSRRLGSE